MKLPLAIAALVLITALWLGFNPHPCSLSDHTLPDDSVVIETGGECDQNPYFSLNELRNNLISHLVGKRPVVMNIKFGMQRECRIVGAKIRIIEGFHDGLLDNDAVDGNFCLTMKGNP